MPASSTADPSRPIQYVLLLRPAGALHLTVVVLLLAAVTISVAGAAVVLPQATMKSVYVLDLNRADRNAVKLALENDVLKAPLTAYLPHNKYLVCLSRDQADRVKAMQVDVDILPKERRLAPGLASQSAQNHTELILELCHNPDRDLTVMLDQARPDLDALDVVVEPVSDKRLKARIKGTASPAEIAAALIDLLGEVVWVEKKSQIVLL